MTNRQSETVLLKGSGNGLKLIIPRELPISKVLEDAGAVLDGASAMVGGMAIAIDTGDRSLNEEDLLLVLRDLILSYSIKVSFWRSDDLNTREMLFNSGFRVDAPSALKCDQDYDALVIDRSLRSGQRISHLGDVLVMGNVHDGAEVSASGNICVFGRLSGVAHAGSNGDDRRFITADNFNARQIRIGSKVSNDVDLSDHPWWGRPVIISVERGAFQITERK